VSDQPARWVDRLVGACVSLFVGAVALYGAIYLVTAVWVQVAIGAAVLALSMLGWVVWQRQWRW